jgi:hypothetical protein
MKCKKCGSNKIKTRTNYPFGKSSKGKTTIICCKNCGNKKMEKVEKKVCFFLG